MENLFGTTKLCHFTSVENARRILSNGTFYLSKFNLMNDLAEARLHKDEMDKIFSLSFCHSESLNIPLFYLYGGLDGKGCRIQFTAAKMNELLSNCKIHYVNKNNICLKKEVKPTDYSIEYDWIYYVASNGYCEHRDVPLTFQSFDDTVTSLKSKEKHYFIKNMIWKFEKEFRIIVRFADPVPYDRVALKFNIKDGERGLSLMCGPEYCEEDIDNIRNEFTDYGIAKIVPSTINTISMRLAEKNK
jgi:hypothetical protein